MNEISSVLRLRQPEEIDDPLTNVLRAGARQLLMQAVECEAAAFLASMQDLKRPSWLWRTSPSNARHDPSGAT